MERITQTQLEAIVRRINDVTGSPQVAWTKTESGCKANIGCYHLNYAYGGVSLERMVSVGGGVQDVFRCGHVTKRELANRMWAFLEGLEAAKTKLDVLATA